MMVNKCWMINAYRDFEGKIVFFLVNTDLKMNKKEFLKWIREMK